MAIKLKDKKVQDNLKTLDPNTIIEVHGTLTFGDPLDFVKGKTLEMIQERDKKNGRPASYIPTEPNGKRPRVCFTLSDVTNPLTGDNGKPANAFEALINQKVQRWEDESGNEKTNLKEELTRKIQLIGYRKGDKVIPLANKSLEGKILNNGQGITITYEIYEYEDEMHIGVANMIFDEYPSFYNGSGSRIGAKKSQNWATEEESVAGGETSEAGEPVAEEATEETAATNVWA